MKRFQEQRWQTSRKIIMKKILAFFLILLFFDLTVAQTTAIKNIEIDEEAYNLIIPFTQTQTFGNGSSVTYSLSKSAISIYDYEDKLNESKRNINLINSAYVNQVETQYQSLVKS